MTAQFGARVQRASYRPLVGLDRDLTDLSTSVGLLFTPQAAHDRLTVAVSLARAARSPALEELYFFGVHAGNFAFEIGNPNLNSEKALGLDVSLRWRYPRVSGEVTYFRNSISDYIFRSPLPAEEFERDFPGESAEDFPIVRYVAADSVLQGFEAHSDVELTRELVAELCLDYVRGDVTTINEPLPRIPPLRGRVGLRYQANAFQAGGEVVAAAKQDRRRPFLGVLTRRSVTV